MQTEANYEFHAAHRNQYAPGLQKNIHGHTYRVNVKLDVGQIQAEQPSWSLIDINKKLEPHFAKYQHSLLIDINDPLYAVLVKGEVELGLSPKVVIFNCPTIVENVARRLYFEIAQLALNVDSIGVRVWGVCSSIYTKSDALSDQQARQAMIAQCLGQQV